MMWHTKLPAILLTTLASLGIVYADERHPIATFDWSAAETLAALAVSPLGVTQLKGYNTWTNSELLPAETLELGMTALPNLELMSHFNPSLILGNNRRLAQRLEQIAPAANISLFPITGAPWQATQDFTLTLAERLGRQEDAERLVAASNQRLASLSNRLPAAQDPLLIVQFRDDRHVWVYGQSSLLQGVVDQLGLTNAWNRPTGDVGVSVISIDALPAIEGRLVILKSPQYSSAIRDRLDRSELWQELLRIRGGDAVYVDVNYWPLGALPSAMRFAEALVEELENS